MNYADFLCQNVMWKKIKSYQNSQSALNNQRIYNKSVKCQKEILVPGEKIKIGSVTTLYKSSIDQSDSYYVNVAGSFITTPKQTISSVSGYYVNFYVVNTETNEELEVVQKKISNMSFTEGTDYSVSVSNGVQLKNAHPFSTFDLYCEFEGYGSAGVYDENPNISISSISLGGFFDNLYLVDDYNTPNHLIGAIDVEV